MTRKYFGTDGIRGRANSQPMTAEIAMKVGMAAGVSFQRGERAGAVAHPDVRSDAVERQWRTGSRRASPTPSPSPSPAA